MNQTTSLLQYRQTPAAIMAILNLFHQHKIRYVLFKCEHIFEGQNKNLDILFETDAKYRHAFSLLQEKGFVLRFGETFEKYKKMYCRYEHGIITSIHLHREIAWHGMVALDKSTVFARAKKIHPLIVIPSLEDAILIHAGHVLFENFRITEREQQYFQSWDKNIDKAYILRQVQQYHWQRGFEKIISRRDCIEIFAPWNIYPSWAKKLWWEPVTWGYVSWKIIKKILQKFDFRRKGCLIALIGVNGSGKTTLSKELVEVYTPFTNHLGIRSHYYYFGWEPTFIITKIISTILRKARINLFQQQALSGGIRNDSKNIKSCSSQKGTAHRWKILCILQELSFVYQFFEFLYRYHTRIRPKLQQRGVVVTDRYFYDLFGQYPYARNSRILPRLIKLFPKPDFTFVLRCSLDQLIARDKFDRHENKSRLRKTFSPEYLQQQMENYALIKEYVPVEEIDSTDKLQNITQKILDDSWKAVVRGS